MELFDCTYFNGKSSSSFPASVLLKDDELVIHYREATGETITERWNVNAIVKNEFAGKQISILKFGEFPFQTIEINNPAFAERLKEKYPSAPFNRLAQNFYNKLNLQKILLLGAVFIALVLAVYFYLLPVVADAFSKNLSYETEHSLGSRLNEKFLSEFETDTVRTELMNKFFNEMEIQTAHPVNIVVLKNRELNAFAIPGGYIYVFDSIINILDNENELAGLLAHEYSHVELRHSTRAIVRNLAGYMFLSVLLGDVSGVSAVILQNAESLKQLQYSRGLEEEADKHGMELMRKSNINPEGMPDLLERLKKYSQDSPLEIISSHPLLEKRIQYLHDEIKKSSEVKTQNTKLEDTWKKLKEN